MKTKTNRRGKHARANQQSVQSRKTTRSQKATAEELPSNGSSQPVRQRNRSPVRTNAPRSGPAFRPSDAGFSSLFGGYEESASGLVISEYLALNLSSLYSGVNRIAGAMSTMPVKVIKTDYIDDFTTDSRSGTKYPIRRVQKTQVTDHPVHNIFNFSPDGNQRTSVVWRQTSQGHALLAGNACSEIIRNGRGQAIQLHLCDPRQCVPYLDQLDGRKKFSVSRIDGKVDRPLENDQIFHIPAYSWDGVTGISPVRLAKDSIGLGLVTQQYGNRFFKDGRPAGFLKTPNFVSEKKRKQHRAEWAEMHEGQGNWQSVGLLSGGMEWEHLGVSMEEAQFLSTREFQVDEIARWLGMNPYMLGRMVKVGLNILDLMIDFVVFTLLPWVKKWEAEANMKLFTRVEQFKYSVVFDMSGLLRADFAKRAEVLEKMLKNGVITVNEWRELEERNFFGTCGDVPIVMASQYATLPQVESGELLKNKAPSSPAEKT